MKFYANRDRRNIKASSMPAPRRKLIKADTDRNPWEDIELNKSAYINRWQREYEGEPDTTWDNIWDNVLEEFKLYANDEASGFIEDKFYNGELSADDMDNEFEHFIMWADLGVYDTDGEIVDYK